jgi:phosphoenolpyruvate-protein kinase (PTS system EI component)
MVLAAAANVSDENVTAALLVLQNAGRREFSTDDIEVLATICAQLGGHPAPVAVPAAAEHRLQGVGASPGIAMGLAMFRGSFRRELSSRELLAGEPAAERARVRLAVEKTRSDLLRVQVAAREIDEEYALIFASHLLLLSDPLVIGRIDEEIGSGKSAPRAIDNALGDFETRLRRVPNAYIRERLDDVDDLRGRLLAHALDDGTREQTGEGVVLSSRLAPSMVVEFKTEGARALVTEGGGTNSHGVLLARAIGIPAVTGIMSLLSDVRPNDRLIVDGWTGVVIVRPTPETAVRYEDLRVAGDSPREEHDPRFVTTESCA